MLPENTIDFKAQQGILNNEIVLNKNGDLILAKKFKPGLSLISIAFQVPLSKWYSNHLIFKTPYEIKELSIASLKTIPIQFSGPNFTAGIPNMLGTKHYRGIIQKNILEDQTLSITLKGLPRGFAFSWIMASISFCILISLVSFLLRRDTIKQRI